MGDIVAEQGGPLPKMSGYLMKKSTAGDWQKRYFETNGTFLTYYKSQKMSKLLAALSLLQIGEISLCSSGEEATFQLDLKDRQYILKADSQQQAQDWVVTLVFLRDGGGVKTADNTPSKGDDDTAPSQDQENSDEGVAVYPSSPKRAAAEGPNAGTFVKAGSSMGADQCAAGCSIF